MHAISDDHIKCMQVRPIAKKITEKFLTDITQFCEGAIDQATEGQKDIIKAELNALVGLAIVLKEESLPMIEVLMNINKKLSTSDFESVITQGEGHSLFGNMLNNTFTDNPTINGLLSGSLTISAAMIFLRASACEALVHVAVKLGPIFEPCIPDTLDILQVNSEYKYNNLIVKSGVEGIPKIFGLIKDLDKPEVFRTRILPTLTNNLDKLVKRRDKISRIEGAINVLEDCLAKYVPLDLSDLTDFLTKSGSGVMGALKFGIDNRNSLIQSYEELGNFTTEYDTMELMERLSDNSVIFGAISNLL